MAEAIYRKRLSLGDMFGLSFWQEFIKWCFTWVIALLPIMFLLLKQYLNNSDVKFYYLTATGEIFLVCIVMIAEPLGRLVVSKNKGTSVTSLLILLAMIISLLSAAYYICFIEMSEKRIHHCMAQLSHCDNSFNFDHPGKVSCHIGCTDCNSYHSIHKAEDVHVDSLSVVNIDNQSVNDSFIAKEGAHGTPFVDTNIDVKHVHKNDHDHVVNMEDFDNFVIKIQSASLIWFVFSFMLGFGAVLHMHVTEVRFNAKS